MGVFPEDQRGRVGAALPVQGALAQIGGKAVAAQRIACQGLGQFKDSATGNVAKQGLSLSACREVVAANAAAMRRDVGRSSALECGTTRLFTLR